MGKIIFFEDEVAFAKKIRDDLSKTIGSKSVVQVYNPSKQNREQKTTFIDRIGNDLKNEQPIDLVVADEALYELDSYEGLSAEIVIEVCNRLLIPICIYSRKNKSARERFEESKKTTIILKNPPDYPDTLKEIRNLFEGFVKIKSLFKKLKKDQSAESPPKILAKLLNKPQYLDRFSMYNFDFEFYIGRIPKGSGKEYTDYRNNAIPYLLSNWLLLSILKFPGILLNEIATASYLNIDPADFGKLQVKNIFKKAIYKGPFSKMDNYYWRYELDEIINQNKANDGLEVAKERISNKIKSCKCSIDPSLTAGYYCVVEKKPVSLKNSTDEVSWIPVGADLSRVSLPIYQKLKPWLLGI